ncbi:hypothetical protein JCM8097_009213 [Rhodosporidiobolus ruineniae]
MALAGKRPRQDALDGSPSSKRAKPNRAPPAPPHHNNTLDSLTSTASNWVGPWKLFTGGIDAFKNLLHLPTPTNPASKQSAAPHLPSPGTTRARSRPNGALPTSPFSPARLAYPTLSDQQLRARLREARKAHQFEDMDAKARGAEPPSKPAELREMNDELKRRKQQRGAAQAQAKGKNGGVLEQLARGTPRANGTAVGGAAGAPGPSRGGYQRRAPMGAAKNRLPPDPTFDPRPAPPSPDLPTPSLFSSRPSPPPPPNPPRTSSTAKPRPPSLPKPPFAPSWDPSTYSPPPSPRLRTDRATAKNVRFASSGSTTSLAPLPDAFSPNSPTFPSTSSPSSRRPRPSKRQHKATLARRDDETLLALSHGATVHSPAFSPSLSSSTLVADPEADDDDDYFGALRGGECLTPEERKRREDYEAYQAGVKAKAEAEERKQGLDTHGVKIHSHKSSASSRARRGIPAYTLLNHSNFFPSASPLFSPGLSAARSKPSQIPLPSSSAKLARRKSGVDEVLAKARSTMAEKGPKYLLEDYTEMRRVLEEEKAAEEEEEEEEEVGQKRRIFPPALAPEYQKLVDAAFRNRSFHSVIKGAEVAHRDLIRIRGETWLNDETINFVGVMINLRSDAADAKEKELGEGQGRGEGERRLKKVWCMNTNFYNTFKDKGFDKVKRWTKKFDTFAKDTIIIPINQGGSHWVCAAVNIRDKRIEYYDSLGSARPVVYATLRKWVEAEHLNRKKEPIDLEAEGWENYWDDDRPGQENSYDCGVFTCMFMECLSREVDGFDFTQEDMPYLRNKLALMVDQKELLEIEEWA